MVKHSAKTIIILVMVVKGFITLAKMKSALRAMKVIKEKQDGVLIAFHLSLP